MNHQHHSTITAAQLLAERAWLAGLARQLVGGAAEADDLTQETLARALSHPPAQPGALRGWLGTVMRNDLRTRARRRRPLGSESLESEERASAEPTPAELAARLELGRMLTRELLALDEPLRDVLILRFYEGLEPREIARRLDQRPGTVRWRLHEGLARLRTRLDSDHGGDRRAWVSALLPIARERLSPTIRGSALLSLGGAGLLGLATQAALVLALLSAGTWWLLRGERSSTSALRPTAGGQVSERRVATGEEGTRLDASDAVASSTQGIDTIASEPPAPSTTRVRARFLDADDRPVSAVRFSARYSGVELAATSGADGVAILESELLPAEASIGMRALTAAGAYWSQRVRVAPGDEIDLGDLRLQSGAIVRGRLFDEYGHPLPNLKVEALTAPPEGVERPSEEVGWSGRSAADGSFEVAGLAAERVLLEASRGDGRRAVSEPIDLRVGELVEGVELRMSRPAEWRHLRLHLAYPDGRPAGGVYVVQQSGRTTCSGTSSAGGEWNTGELEQPVERLFAWSAAERVYAWQEDLFPSEEERVVVLERTADPLIVEAVDPDGRAIAGAVVDVRIEALGAGWPLSYRDDLLGGRVELDLPACRYTLRVRAEGYREETVGPVEPRQLSSPYVQTLHALGGVTGRVLARGMPVANARVELHGIASDPQTAYWSGGFPCRFDPQAASTAVTDAEGRYRLFVEEGENAQLLCRAEGWPLAEIGPLELDPERWIAAPDLLLQDAGSLSGRLTWTSGRNPAGTIVGMTRGDGLSQRTLRVDSEGRYRFDDLPPGDWYLSVLQTEALPAGTYSYSTTRRRNAWTHPFNCTILAGQPSIQNLDLAEAPAFVLRGSLRFDGLPAAGWVADLRPSGDDPFTRATRAHGTLATDGHFALEALGEGRYELLVQSGAEGGLRLTAFLDPGTLELPLELDLALGRIHGTLPPSLHGEPLHYVWSRGALLATRPLRADASGRYTLDALPAGPARICRVPSGAPRDDPERWEVLRSLELAAGQDLAIDL